MDAISLMFVSSLILTTLKGLNIVSRPDIHLQSYLLLDSSTCLGVTETSSFLKSYWWLVSGAGRGSTERCGIFC